MHRFLKFIIMQCNTEKVLSDIQAKSLIINNEISKEYSMVYIQAKTEQTVKITMFNDLLQHALLLNQDNPNLFRDNDIESEIIFNKLYTRVRLEHHLPEHEHIESKSYKNKL